MHIPTLGRRRLLEAALCEGRLNVLHAASGWGKTSLLRESFERAHERGLTPIWVTLEAPDSGGARVTPASLWAAVAEAMAHAVSEAALPSTIHDAFSVLSAAPGREAASRALGTLLRCLDGALLLLDSLDELVAGTDEVWSALVDVVRRDPRARITVATRNVTGLDPHAVTAGTHVIVATEHDLGFSDRDVEELITATFPEAVILGSPAADQPFDLTPLPRVHQRPFPSLSSLARHVVLETDGHVQSIVTGLKSCTRHPDLHRVNWRAMRRQHLLAGLNRVNANEVLAATTWMPYFDLALACSLTGIDAAEVKYQLTRLEQQGHGRWVTAHTGDVVFAYAPGVCDAAAPRRHGTASQSDAGISWLVSIGALTDALVLALRARELLRASDLYRRMLVTHPFALTAEFESALRDIAPADLNQHPILAMARGITLLNRTSTRDIAGVFLAPVAHRDPASIRRGSVDEELLELTAQSMALQLLGRPAQSTDTALEAYRRIAETGFGVGLDADVFTPLASHLSQALFEAGHVKQAQHLMSYGSASAPASHLHLWGVYGRAWHGLDGRGQAAAEMTSLLTTGPDARPLHTGPTVAWGARALPLEQVGEATLLLDRWQFEQAAERVAEVRGTRGGNSSIWGAWVRLHASLGLGAHGREAVRVQAALSASLSVPATLGLAALLNALSISWLMSGQVVKARRAHAQVSRHAGQATPAEALLAASTRGVDHALALFPKLREAEGHTVRSRAALETVGAALALRTQADHVASSLLEEAAALYSEHGCRAHLVYLSESDRAALRRLALSMESEPAQRYLDGLENSAPLLESLQHVSLSARELVVLRALATTRSRHSISLALHVSENTVKSQLRSIYRKLEVTNRDEAIHRAIELDLLGDFTFGI